MFFTVECCANVPRSNYDGKHSLYKRDASTDGCILGNFADDNLALSDSDEEHVEHRNFGDMTLWTRPHVDIGK